MLCFTCWCSAAPLSLSACCAIMIRSLGNPLSTHRHCGPSFQSHCLPSPTAAILSKAQVIPSTLSPRAGLPAVSMHGSQGPPCPDPGFCISADPHRTQAIVEGSRGSAGPGQSWLHVHGDLVLPQAQEGAIVDLRPSACSRTPLTCAIMSCLESGSSPS